jgi:hypothetical protein
MTRRLNLTAGFLWMAAAATSPAGAQGTAEEAVVHPAAAFEQVMPTLQQVRFRHQPTQVGDRVVQRLGVHLALATKITQSGQTAHESTNEMRRQQQRTIEVLEVAEGRATRARASFQVSRRQAPEYANPNELIVQPIEGKAYLVSREEDRLTITDEEGHLPSAEEYKLVAESLENVGKPNPLAALLVDRKIAIGQRILVPRDTVQSLLGFDDPLGTVHRFELTLNRVEPAGEKRASMTAVFVTAIEVLPNDESPLRITLNGEMAIETETCRMAAVNLSGPVQLSSIERTAGGIFQFSAGGELKLAIRSQYDRRPD